MSVQAVNSIIKLENIDSTNNYATQRLVREHWSEGSVVVADFQTNGKGQMGNYWESESGKNLLMSIVLFPSFLSITDQFEISKVISLAVSDVVSAFVEDVAIKWPNDIYVGNRKIAGILIENAIMGTEISWAVAGVGLNINQSVFTSDAPNPVSLTMLTGQEYDKKEVLNLLLMSIDKWYQSIKNGGFEKVDKSYIERLYRMGEVANYCDSNGQFYGTIQGVNLYGHLMVQKENGESFTYGFKEISFL